VSAPPAPQPPVITVSTASSAAEIDGGHEQSGCERYLAHGDAIVAEALAFRDRCKALSSGGSVEPTPRER
jgi:hypothetical protein